MIRAGILRDENPLDTSDTFARFMEACREGDIALCQRLISQGVNVNGKDRFDYTPLIIVRRTPTSLSLLCQATNLS